MVHEDSLKTSKSGQQPLGKWEASEKGRLCRNWKADVVWKECSASKGERGRCHRLSISKILPGCQGPAGLGVPPSLSPVCLLTCVCKAAAGLADAQGGGVDGKASLPASSFPRTAFTAQAWYLGPSRCVRKFAESHGSWPLVLMSRCGDTETFETAARGVNELLREISESFQVSNFLIVQRPQRPQRTASCSLSQ